MPAAERLRCFDEFVGLALVLLGDFGRIRRLLLLILGVTVPVALGVGAGDAEQHGQSGNGEMPPNRNLKLKHA